MESLKRPLFDDVSEYGQCFADADYWHPYVSEVIRRHNLPGAGRVRETLPGTHPVFIVDERFVVKFFTHLFQGSQSAIIEKAVYDRLTKDSFVPAAALVGSGDLFPVQDGQWHWPYLITTVVEGSSFGETEPHTWEDRVHAAAAAGVLLRQFHSQRLSAQGVLSAHWHDFDELLERRRRAMCMPGALDAAPPHVRPLIKARLESASPPFDPHQTCHLLHGDLNADHLFGVQEAGGWRFTGVIDFGDVKVGDPIYDFVPLHIGLFRCDKRLLRICLDAYEPDRTMLRDFAQRAMDYTWLYESCVVKDLFAANPAFALARTMEELGGAVWNVNQQP